MPDIVRLIDNVIDISRFPLPQQQEEAQAEAAHRSRRHRAGRCADPVRRCATARPRRSPRPKPGSARSSAPPISPRPRSPPRRAPSRCSTATSTWPARPSPGSTPTIRDGDRRARHPQRAPDLGGADRHDLAVRRQRLLRPRAGVQLPLHAQRADAGRHAPRGGGHRLRLSRSSAASRAKPRRCPIISSTRRPWRPRTTS